MATPAERSFVVFNRGVVRDDIILAYWRNVLRTSVNPASGQVFTEEQVQLATQPGSRWYIEADAIDLMCQALQQRALSFVAQIDPRRANATFLEMFHGRLWLGENSRLPAVGASGQVLATGVGGTIIPGSQTLGSPTAAVATDPNGLRYQNLATTVIDLATGEATLTMKGIDTGFVTRLPTNTELTWSTGINPGTDPTATVLAPFDGGFDVESDEEYGVRIAERIRNRPASGNPTHFQAWAQEATTAVEQAFVYPCALNAGSVLVAIAEKRGDILTSTQVPEGPLARVPSAATLITVANYLVAPNSPVVPQRVAVFPVPINPQSSDLILRVSMSEGRTGGWADTSPWPTYSASAPDAKIKTVSGDGLTLEVESDQSLPNNAPSLTAPNAPSIMIWDENVSRWVQLDVASITDPSPGSSALRDFTIVLNAEPVMYDSSQVARTTPVIAVDDRVSPYTDRLSIMSQAIEEYFDSLGPGEVVLDADPRSVRAARQPRPANKYPIRAGQALISYIIDALGGTAADAELTSISRNEPDVPTNIIDGPNYVVMGHINVFPL